MDRLVDINRLAEILSVKPATIYGWVHEGYIPHIKLGKLVRFSVKEVEEWLKDKRRRGRKNRVPEVELISKGHRPTKMT